MRTEFAKDLIGINLSFWADVCQEDPEAGPEEINICLRKLVNHFDQDQAIINELKVEVQPFYSFYGEKLLNVKIPKINLNETLSMNDLAKRCIRVLKDTSACEEERFSAGEIYSDDIDHFMEIFDEKQQTYSFIFRIVVWARNLFSNWQIQSFKENYNVSFQKDEDGNRTGVRVQSRKEMMIARRVMQEVTPLANQIEQAFQEMGGE